MSTARSDAATSTDDIVKGRPLCLFYFAHPFGVLSCEPPTVVPTAPPPPTAAAPPTPAPAPAGSAMARRSPTWPTGACARRLPPYIRTLPPLKLPTPRDSSSVEGSSEDVWSFAPPEKMSLPPISLPISPPPATWEARPMRARRPGPVGVRKGGARGRGPALVRLLRRAVGKGGVGVEVSPRGLRGSLGTVRAAWQPAGAGAQPSRSSLDSNSSSILVGGERSVNESSAALASGMGCRGPPLPHRRYSVPETVMRRYRLAREVQEEAMQDDEPPACAVRCAPREWVRRSALLRRMGGALPSAPCRCDTRSLDGGACHPSRSPDFVLETTLLNRPLPAPTNDHRFEPRTTPDVLEIVVSETSPAPASQPTPLPASRLSDSNLNIDEYVSNILVESLNSLTDRLESMTVSIGGGDGRISVVEKEIKVKLQNKGVNTVVHLSPTSNNQIIFGNRELCEREVSLILPPERIERLFCDEFQASGESWCAPARTASPCASLVDSLDDPASPRVAPPVCQPPPPPPPAPVPPPVTIEPSQVTPLSSVYTDMKCSPHREKCESFFIRMDEDNCACEKENIIVADHMPEKIKQRLYRRHRRREMRAQGARRGAARRNAQRDIQRQCAALVDSLIDDAIAKVAREEHSYVRIARRAELHSQNENGVRSRLWNGQSNDSKGDYRTREESKRIVIPSQVSHPSQVETRERVPPRRLYHKSEIHNGGKCIEILEIVEYTNTPRSSSETNSDESPNAAKARRSRIPVPIQDKTEQQRNRRATVATSASPPTPTTAAPTVIPARRTSLPRSDMVTTSSALRFERVFDVIPEERSSLSVESASEDLWVTGRRSAATSPLVPPGSTSGSLEEASNQKVRGRRTIGTQWTKPTRVKQSREKVVVNDLGSKVPVEDKQSSSDCECESAGEAHEQVARRRVRAAPRAHRRRPPPRASPAGSQATAVANTGGDGWSLTLAGSCRAALPSRLDLRLRFPPAGPEPAPASSNTDRYSDAQDREWSSTCKHPTAKRCGHVAPAIRYESSGESRGRAVRRRSVQCEPSRARAAPASSDALPALALGATPHRAHLQATGGHCHSCGGVTPATGGTTEGTGSSRGPLARTQQELARLDRLPHTTLQNTLRSGGEGSSVKTLAVLGCAIVPARRAAPPTASQRDLRRARLARRARRHSLATEPAHTTHCSCYTYT